MIPKHRPRYRDASPMQPDFAEEEGAIRSVDDVAMDILSPCDSIIDLVSDQVERCAPPAQLERELGIGAVDSPAPMKSARYDHPRFPARAGPQERRGQFISLAQHSGRKNVRHARSLR